MPEGTDFTIDEMICVCISRQIEDGDLVAQGLATPLVAAGYLLAWHTHAPDIYFASAIGQSICKEGAPLGLERAESLWLDYSLNSFGFVQAAADLLPRVRPKEFFRPGQVDRNGNFNNIAFGRDYRNPRMRMPGTGGIPDVTVVMEQFYLYVPRHNRVTFVEEVDYLSGMGHHKGRTRGNGPQYLVTDLGQFDFDGGELRLTHLHPGVSVDRVKAKTGFELRLAEELSQSQPPSSEEVRLLREVIDPLGIRKLELMSGPARKEALREMLSRERNPGSPQA